MNVSTVVYVVVARVDYEASTVLGVGQDREAAEAIVKRRRDFEALPNSERERLTFAHGEMAGDYCYSYDEIEIEEHDVEYV